MDIFGLSIYPLWSYISNSNILPENYISIFQSQSGLPLAIGETGWQHSTIQIDDPFNSSSCIDLLPSSESLQSWWIDKVLSEAETLNMPLVVWWSDHDVLPQSVSGSCICTNSKWCSLLDGLDPIEDVTLRFFGSMGLRDYNGDPRPGLQAWQNAVFNAPN